MFNRIKKILKAALLAPFAILFADYSTYRGVVTYSNDPNVKVGSAAPSGSSLVVKINQPGETGCLI